MSIDLTRLSKTAAHALRHEPWIYGLELDDDGWVSIEHLCGALSESRDEWADLTTADVVSMISSSTKNRYELDGDKVRARYGHSMPDRIVLPPAAPPERLFHGTNPEVVQAILSDGLTPRARQYVHLSVAKEMALEVGRRKAAQPTLLVIASGDAYRERVVFYRGNEYVWLADHVPGRFITVQT